MRKIGSIRLRYGLDKYKFYIWENEGRYSLHLEAKRDDRPDIDHRLDISKQQVKKLSRDIEKHFELKRQKHEYVPTEVEILDVFRNYLTLSGKIKIIMDMLGSDPLLKENIILELRKDEGAE